MNKAWITLLSTEDYLEAVLALNESLRVVQSAFPLVVAITESIQNNQKILDVLKKEKIKSEFIKTRFYSQETIEIAYKKKHPFSVLNTASKIGIFELKQYDKLVYIDADTFFVRNADELFNYPDGSAPVKIVENNLLWCFSGLMVIKPKNHYVELYDLLIKDGQCYDGDLLGKLWFHIRDNKEYQIPEYYIRNLPSDKIIEPEVKIYHMCNPDSKLWKKKTLGNSNIEQHYKKLLFCHRMTYPEIFSLEDN